MSKTQTTRLPKPKSLEIKAENGRLVGTDQDGNEWLIGWCGNGAYSHWTLSERLNPEIGWYLYAYPENQEKDLKDTIKAAELKHKIF